MARNTRNKYHNKKVVYDGHIFDSAKEYRRYQTLMLMVNSGIIKNLRMQVPYELIPAQYEPDIITKRGKTKRGKLIERPCIYMADFVYFDNESNTEVVEDAKGVRTKDYIIKRKLMLHIYGIRILEV